MPHVVIIILNWNRKDEIIDCLKSLSKLEYPSYEVVIVDNGSTDGSVPLIRRDFPNIEVIMLKENIGFTGGNNVGISYALDKCADYVLLLNNDTETSSDFLRLLVEAAESDPDIGITGPTIYFFHQPKVIWSAGGSIDWLRGRTSMLGLHEDENGQYGEEPRKVDFVTGCAMLIKRQVIEQVGELDERFFAYYEEVEYCVRASRNGFSIVHVPLSYLWHKISLSEQVNSASVLYYMTRNRLLFLRLAKAGFFAWIYTLLMDNLRLLLAWSIKPHSRLMRSLRGIIIRAVIDACSGRWGKATVR